MNQIATLNNAVKEQDRRKAVLQTAQGRAELEQILLRCFYYLQRCGYKMPSTDPQALRQTAKIWGEVLKDAYVVFGRETIEKAVRGFVKDDNREYNPFPKPGQILDRIKRSGKNPKAELERLKYLDEVSRMEIETLKMAKEMLKDKERVETLYSLYPMLKR